MNVYAVARVCRYRQDVAQRHRAEKMLLGIVEYLSDGGVIPAHYPLHTVERAEHVRAVYHRAAAAADEDVLRVVCHADDLVRHDLTDGVDEIVVSADYSAVDLNVDGR